MFISCYHLATKVMAEKYFIAIKELFKEAYLLLEIKGIVSFLGEKKNTSLY